MLFLLQVLPFPPPSFSFLTSIHVFDGRPETFGNPIWCRDVLILGLHLTSLFGSNRASNIGTKSMQKEHRHTRSSGNPEVSQTHLAISTILIAFRKAIHLNLF